MLWVSAPAPRDDKNGPPHLVPLPPQKKGLTLDALSHEVGKGVHPVERVVQVEEERVRRRRARQRAARRHGVSVWARVRRPSSVDGRSGGGGGRVAEPVRESSFL